jgi:DNA-binding NarL/FixJ family response regulator
MAPRSAAAVASAEVATQVATGLQEIAEQISELRAGHRDELDILLEQRAELVVAALGMGMTQRQIAHELECTPATVARIRAGWQ